MGHGNVKLASFDGAGPGQTQHGMLGARVRRRLRSRDVRGDRTVIDDSACQRKRKSESESESVRYLLVEPSSRSGHSRTSCGRLRLEDLECFAGAEERSDEVHVQDGREELKRHFIDRVHFLEFTCILRIPVRKERKKEREKDVRLLGKTGTYVEQQVQPAKSVDRLLKETLDECLVGNVTVDDETLLGVCTGGFRLLELGQASCRQR